jgi:hypothetical protein
MVQPAKDRMRNNVSGPLDWALVMIAPHRWIARRSPYCLDREKFLFTYAPLIGPHVWLQGEHRWQTKR